MSDCKHENHTIDCVCLDCGYDLIVEPMAERYRQEERERIIKLLEIHSSMTEAEYREHESECNVCLQFFGVGLAIALIKEEGK